MSEVGTRCLPALETDDLAATVDDLRQRGVTVLSGPEASDEGYSVAHIVDVAGNVIELYEFTRPSRA